MRLLLASLLLWVAAGALADQTAAPAEDPPVPAGEPPAPAAEPASAPPPGPPLDPRLEAYEQFRARYDTAHFDEALPFAKRVVELSEAGSDPDYELPIAYNNLGATQFQLGDYPAAEASYRKSLELLEATQGIGSRRLIVPLAGLGTVSAARDQHDLAAAFFARALAVSRRADGLFNLQQLPLIEQSASSLYALADYAGVERERTYALRIAEQNYGYGDPRTLPPLLELAKFYEGLREFIAARMMYLRARDVTMKESQGFSPEAVRALLGVARTHRLQYTMDPETLDSQQPARDEVTGDVVGKVYRESRVPPPAVDRTGLRAVRNALEMLRAVSDPPPQLLIDALTELGDWYQTTSRQGLAYPFYEEASAVFAAHPGQGLVNPLLQPRMVFYRPPVSSRRGLNTLTGQYRIRRAVFEFTVTEAGLTQDLTVVESDMNDAQLSQSRRALGRAVYAPRFEDGKAVASPGVRFTSEWTEQQQPESAPAAPAAAAGRG